MCETYEWAKEVEKIKMLNYFFSKSPVKGESL